MGGAPLFADWTSRCLPAAPSRSSERRAPGSPRSRASCSASSSRTRAPSRWMASRSPRSASMHGAALSRGSRRPRICSRGPSQRMSGSRAQARRMRRWRRPRATPGARVRPCPAPGLRDATRQGWRAALRRRATADRARAGVPAGRPVRDPRRGDVPPRPCERGSDRPRRRAARAAAHGPRHLPSAPAGRHGRHGGRSRGRARGRGRAAGRALARDGPYRRLVAIEAEGGS